MWRISKNNNESFTTEDLLNIVKPIIPDYIDEYYKTHPINFDMSGVVRFYNPDYYVNVIQVDGNTYQDIAGMLYRIDGSTFSVDYIPTHLYVWDYIKLPDGTIKEVNENKTINAPNVNTIEYITGYSTNIINAKPDNAIYNYNSHTHAIEPITTTATTLTINVNSEITELPTVPTTIKTLYLNNCPNVPLLKDSQIEKVICNVATPITLAETFYNCSNINELINVQCTGSIKTNWSYNSNACNLVEYTNLQTIEDYGFYNCKFNTADNRTITFDSLTSVGSHGLYGVENLHVKDTELLGTVALSSNMSVAKCKNCILEFIGTTTNDDNYSNMTDCCFSVRNSYASSCQNCTKCYIEIQNVIEINKTYGLGCNDCVIYLPQATACSAAIGVSSTNLTILAPSLATLNSTFYNSFMASHNARIYLNGTLTKNMAYKQNIEFAVLKSSAQRTAWSRYCGNCIYADTSYNTTTMGFSVFHKTISFPDSNYYIGMSFCNVNNIRDVSGLAVLCQNVTVNDPDNLLPSNYFQHSNNCVVNH